MTTRQQKERPILLCHRLIRLGLFAIVISTLMDTTLWTTVQSFVPSKCIKYPHFCVTLRKFTHVKNKPAAAAAGGSLLVEFLEYRNPTGHDFGGHCCDGKYGFCQNNGCDYIFDICLDLHQQPRKPRVATTTPSGLCRFGRQRSSTIENQNNVDFSKAPWNLTNPIEFHFHSEIPDTVLLRVHVEDYDSGRYWTGGNDFVDSLETDLSLVDLEPGQWLSHTLTQRTRLSIRYSYICENGCGVKCSMTCSLLPPRSPEPVIFGPDTRKTDNQSDHAPTQHPELLDCHDLATHGQLIQDGVQFLFGANASSSEPPTKVYCHLGAGGEGWTVIQRRMNGQEDFNRNWTEYRNGFGRMEENGEFWIGLENIHRLTTRKRCRLLIWMTLSDGQRRFAEYDDFSVADEKNGYRLYVGNCTAGDAGDALKFDGLGGVRSHLAIPFSTPERDNDRWTGGSCAQKYESGWWFNDCYWANLNGLYMSPKEGWPYCFLGRCISWRALDRLSEYSLLETQMALLPMPT